jgi:hypothetical protein
MSRPATHRPAWTSQAIDFPGANRPGADLVLDQFPEALASVRNGEGIKIQVAPGS